MKKLTGNRSTLIAKFGIFDFISLLFLKFFIKLQMYVILKKPEKPDVSFLKLNNNIYIEGNNGIRSF